MNPHACSLRATQCAALIALATAAGIERIDMPQTNAARDAEAETRATQRVAERSCQLAADILAPCFRMLEGVAAVTEPECVGGSHGDTGPRSRAASAGAELLRGVPSTRSAHRFEFWNYGPRARSALRHELPFAIGPPLGDATATHRAEGTEVPNGSAAHGFNREPLRTVDSVLLLLRARLACLSDCRLKPAGEIFDPAFSPCAANHRLSFTATILCAPAVPAPLRGGLLAAVHFLSSYVQPHV